MTQFATAAQLSTYLTGTAADASLPAEFTAQAELLIRLVSADVQQAASTTIEAATATHFLAGSWSRDLELPQRPVRSVTSVAVNGVALASGSWYWNESSLIRRGVSGLSMGESGFDDLGQGASSRDGETWAGPGSTVAVEYAWGFDDLPDWILSMTLRVCARIIGNPAQLSQETLGVYSASYRDMTADGSHILNSERKLLRKMFATTGGTIRIGGA